MSRIVTGRCKPCNLTYQWKPAPSRLLRFSWCRECKRRLRATWASGITSTRVSSMDREEPIFSKYQPEE